MARPQPTFHLLDRRNGWPTGRTEGVAVDRGRGLVLATEPRGPRGLASADGSLGGLALPRRLAVDDDGRVWLLAGTAVRRYEAYRERFVDVPGLGGQGAGPRRFAGPRDLAVAGRLLYVADTGNRRVQVFDRASLALVHLWPGPGGEAAFEPWAVTAAAEVAYVLDRAGGWVFRHRPGSEEWRRVVDDPAAAGRYSALAVDREGRVYLLDDTGDVPRAVVFHDGRKLATISDAGEVRSRFPVPLLSADHRGRFCLPAGLAGECPRPPRVETGEIRADPVAACRHGGGRLFDGRGRPCRRDPEEAPGPPPFARQGTWWSAPLDSRIHRCQWHRLEIDLGGLPAGTRVTVATLTSDRKLSPGDLSLAPEERWHQLPVAVGALQPPPRQDEEEVSDEGRKETDRREMLVQSRQGRYLWLRLGLEADGYGTSAVVAVRVHFPRRSYVEFLPAVFSAEEESRWFLERFLSILQSEWDRVEDTFGRVRALFDPEAVPDRFVDYLASWLDLPLEGSWSAEQKRRLLATVPEVYPRRGTLGALRTVLQVYLWNLTGVEPVHQGGLPAVAEGFRERRRLLLATGEASHLGSGAPLWSRSVVARLQIGTHAREGEVRLVSTDDPERDLFHHHAHRFRVFVPAAWVPDADAEAMLRRAIAAEKPAHTVAELCLLESRLLVGVQSTVGFDTVLGDYVPVHLACAGGDGAALRSRHRLGVDTVLAGRPLRIPPLGTEPWIGAGNPLA